MTTRRILKTQLSGGLVKPPKIIAVSFNQGEQHSPHVLNLREKLNPPPAPSWQPSPLSSLLANPVGHFKQAVTPKKYRWSGVAEWAGERQQAISELKERILNWWERRYQGVSFVGRIIAEEPVKLRLAKVKLSAMPASNLKTSLILWKKFFLARFKHQPKQKIRKERIVFVEPARRAVLGFIIMAVFFVLPLKAFSAYYTLRDTEKSLVSAGTAAFAHLEEGKAALQNRDLIKATEELQTSLGLFSQAQNEISQINPVWRSLLGVLPVVGAKFRNGEQLMMAGSNLTLAALPIISLFNESNDEPVGNRIESIKDVLAQIIPQFQRTNDHLMAVDQKYLPEDNKENFISIRETIGVLTGDLKKIQSLVDSLSLMLGTNEPKNYLVIFQNNNELRPTGGFIGSFAEIRVKNGEIVKLDLPGAGSYQLQGSLKVALVPPTPLQLLVSKWEFQDGNWFPDFPTSARKLEWFYEKSGGPTVDGLIALDTQVILDLLKVTGSIDLPAYGKTITADNFIYEIQKQVELDYDKVQNKPKQILADLAPIFLDKLLKDKKNFLPILAILNRNLNQKHVLVYLNDPTLEGEMVSQGWAGEIKENSNGDYLGVINANIAGGKTDGVIEQTIEHQADIKDDGTVINTVRVTRTHHGSPTDLFTNLQNVSYIRFYVPEDSELLASDGFGWPEEKLFKVSEPSYQPDADLKRIEADQKIDSRDGTVITKEFGKTVFGNWVMTKQGQTSIVTIVYRLPFKLTKPVAANWAEKIKEIIGEDKQYSSYSLLAQKQPGRNSDKFIQTLKWPISWQAVWFDPVGVYRKENQSVLESDLTEDRYLGVIWQYQD
ncbi:MAG: DUF4012 domain-containing protein [Patescibacteria group bacterium]